MAWGAAATGTPAATGSTGQGLSLMQESLAEITCAAAAAGRAQHGAGAGRLLAGDPRRRSRRLPPPRAGADGRARGGRARRSWRSTSPRGGATRCCCSATTTSRTPSSRSVIRRRSTSARARRRLGARRVDRWHRPRQADLAARHHQAARARRLRPRRALPRRARRATERDARPASTPLVETVGTDDADVVVVAFGTPARYVRAAVRELREPKASGSGSSVRSRWCPSRPRPLPRRPQRRPRGRASTRTTRAR